jgi:hypothetical protein
VAAGGLHRCPDTLGADGRFGGFGDHQQQVLGRGRPKVVERGSGGFQRPAQIAGNLTGPTVRQRAQAQLHRLAVGQRHRVGWA